MVRSRVNGKSRHGMRGISLARACGSSVRCIVIGVRISPGATALTLTLCSAVPSPGFW
jgi:hypothetical protein